MPAIFARSFTIWRTRSGDNSVPRTLRNKCDDVRLPTSDGRSLGLTLSAEGEALLTAIKAQIDAHEASVTARIPPTHRAHLMPILHALWPEGETE